MLDRRTYDVKSFTRVRRKPSAIKLRVALPVERNKTLGLVRSFLSISSTRIGGYSGSVLFHTLLRGLGMEQRSLV